MQPFPINLLDPVMSEYVRQSAKCIGCDPTFIALPLLSALGAALGNARWIRLKNGWAEPPVIWTATVGVSGEKKSPGMDAATAFTKDRMMTLEADHKRAMRGWRRRREEDEDEAGEKPVMQRVAVGDCTMEKLIRLLKDAPRGLLQFRDELAGWFGSFNQYRKGGGDLEYFLSMFRAGVILYDRKSGDGKNGSEPVSIHIARGAVSITGSIQPEVLRDSLSDRFFENGLVARFLFAAPPEKKRYWSEIEVDPEVRGAVARVFDMLWSLKMNETDHGHEPVYLKLSPEAKPLWVQWYNQHQDDKHNCQGHLRAALSKHEGYCARFALILQMCRWAALAVQGDTIDAESLRAAIDLMRWFRPETERVYGLVTGQILSSQARVLLEWAEGRADGVKVREVQQRFWRFFPCAKAAEDCLEGIVKQGLLTRIEEPPGPKGGHFTVRYVAS